MGRQASINIDDVRLARNHLIAQNKPHGIIAIRRQIGRGSPQLISKLLRQLINEPSVETNKIHTGTPSRASYSPDINQAWQHFSHEVDQLLTGTTPSSTPISPTGEYRQQELEELVSKQQQQLERLETLTHNLEERLMQQQDLFDSWRHEQQAERQMLRQQLEQLAQLAGNKRAPRKKRKRGTQLDLYDDSKG